MAKFLTFTDDGVLQLPWLEDYTRKKTAKAQFNLFKKAFEKYLKPGGTLLDIPSGSGVLFPLFRKYQLPVYAVGSALEKTAQIESTRIFSITFQEMPADRLRFPDKAFDCLTSSGLLEHLPEERRQKIWGEWLRVTRNFVFLSVRLRTFSSIELAGRLSGSETFQPSQLSLKDMKAFLSRQPDLELLEILKKDGLALAVLQKK